MFKFSKSRRDKKSTNHSSTEQTESTGWLGRLRHGLKRSRQRFGEQVDNLIKGKKVIDDELFEELETALLLADVGVDTTEKILAKLTQSVKRNELSDPASLLSALKQGLIATIEPLTPSLEITNKPFIILMVGVNGAGKTTSIAKLAHYFQQQGKRVMLAAGDTFRAAAIEQLQTWGERNDVPVISQHTGADSASVIFDAMQAATARNYDILIADTAGRLHTQNHLMTELQKIKRVITKLDDSAPHETMLVLDASMGQNALIQAQQFHKAIELSSITLTKLDGTAKGGIVFAIADNMQLPLRFIGVGEQIDDLKPFDAKQFVDALFE